MDNFEIITWPEIQEYMDCTGFHNNCILISDIPGAYCVNSKWKQKQDARNNPREFNNTINDFISWYLRKSIIEDISEEDFEDKVDEYKEEIINNLTKLKEVINKLPNYDNPFVPLIFLMLFPSLSDTMIQSILENKSYEE